jgi:hypothetical protein
VVVCLCHLSSTAPRGSYLHAHSVAVVWGPDASDTLADTGDGLGNSLDLLTASIPQQLCLLQDRRGLHVLDAYRLDAAVDIVANHDRVLPWSRRNGELDLGVALGELRELALDKGTVILIVRNQR